jgi:glutamine cyclotransferase
MRSTFTRVLLAIAVFVTACNGGNDQPAPDEDDNSIPAPITLTYQVVNQFPHDTSAFTEGFSFHNGQLYESTGSPAELPNSGTWIASIDLKTGKYDRKVNLGTKYFGEGITFIDGKVYQLTWKDKKGFVYDAKTFKQLREFPFNDDGWGMTSDGKHLIISTGSSNIYYLTPDSLSFVKKVEVQDNNGYVGSINELEYIDGFIYANKWLTSEILKIDPNTGRVVAKLDLSKQTADAKSKFPGAQEMNGIAYDSTTGKTYVTGKKWPLIYEIKW